MRHYRSGRWGFTLIWGLRASVFPQAFALALPNAIVAWVLAEYRRPTVHDDGNARDALILQAAFTSVLFWVLYFRSTVAYNRWWEGGTLLQQTRGEWFNAYSSLIAFSSTDPKMANAVEAYHHQLARFMSLLFCSALQQVSPDPERAFEILDGYGLDAESLQFLAQSSDRVEVILQWIQRSTIINMSTGILPIPPPVMSRAFQEISRGIVNLQNARKIAEFPFPFPYAQTSIVMLLVHWAVSPILASMLLDRWLAAATSFASIFFLWCMNYTALQLESPFGCEANDLPMDQMQSDWNKSVGTLLAYRAQYPPTFHFDAVLHRRLNLRMSDGSQSLKKRMTVGKFLEQPGVVSSSAVGRSTSNIIDPTDSQKSIQLGTILLDRSASASASNCGMSSLGVGGPPAWAKDSHAQQQAAQVVTTSSQAGPFSLIGSPPQWGSGKSPDESRGGTLSEPLSRNNHISRPRAATKEATEATSSQARGDTAVAASGDDMYLCLFSAKPKANHDGEEREDLLSGQRLPRRRPREMMPDILVEFERTASWSSSSDAYYAANPSRPVPQERVVLPDRGTSRQGPPHGPLLSMRARSDQSGDEVDGGVGDGARGRKKAGGGSDGGQTRDASADSSVKIDV